VQTNGDVTLTITADPSFELDYICIMPGTYTDSGEPGDTGNPTNPGVGHCNAPPTAVITNDLNSWLPSIWIWENDATNYETVATYGVGWLRLIGCEITEFRAETDTSLTKVIELLESINTAAWVGAIAAAITALASAIGLLGDVITDLLQTLAGPTASLIWILGILAVFFAALLKLMQFILWLLYMFWAIPNEFWTSMQSALTGTDEALLSLPDSEAHPLYFMIYGFQIINQTIGQTILYPIAILGIAVGSIYIYIWTIKKFRIRL